MPTLATTRMSSKGQVVIPEAIRVQFGLSAGTQFVVLAQRDVMILRAITPPPMDEFSELIAAVRRAARRIGMQKSAMAAATVRVRSRRRAGRSGK